MSEDIHHPRNVFVAQSATVLHIENANGFDSKLLQSPGRALWAGWRRVCRRQSSLPAFPNVTEPVLGTACSTRRQSWYSDKCSTVPTLTDAIHRPTRPQSSKIEKTILF